MLQNYVVNVVIKEDKMKEIEKRLFNDLVDLARQQKMLTYGDVFDLLGFGLDFRTNTELLKPIMKTINDYCFENKFPIITAIIYTKGSSPKMSGNGFFEASEERGQFDGKDRRKFYYAELHKIFLFNWRKI